MPRTVQWMLGLFIVCLMVGGPLGYASYQHRQFRNFHPVHQDVLYRSGQLTLPGLKQVIHDHGIQTVISLRAGKFGGPNPDQAEEDYCKAAEINYFRIPAREWSAPDGSVPAQESIRAFLEVMDNPANYPVLIHCFAGMHRTGSLCAIYRMEFEDWSNREAIDEMEAQGYENIDEEWDILDYLERYRPRKYRDATLMPAEAE